MTLGSMWMTSFTGLIKGTGSPGSVIATAGGTDLSTRLAAIDARQKAYNARLATLAADYRSRAASTGVEVVTDYDPTGSATSVGNYSFQPGDINGGDCFHPSIQGQNKLSEVIWNRNPHK